MVSIQSCDGEVDSRVAKSVVRSHWMSQAARESDYVNDTSLSSRESCNVEILILFNCSQKLFWLCPSYSWGVEQTLIDLFENISFSTSRIFVNFITEVFAFYLPLKRLINLCLCVKSVGFKSILKGLRIIGCGYV